ncbi:MAG: nuclear transport factor 2 family protein [Bdellovibrionota bacterium]
MAQEKLDSKEFFSKLSPKTMNLVEEFYDEKILFQDPLGKISGLKAMKDYYSHLYEGAEYVHFEFDRQLKSGNEEVLFWKMTLKSKNLNSGKEYSVTGNSHMIFSTQSHKCVYHRDYFDMGSFVYERIPFLKNIIHFVKGKMKEKK